MVFLLLSFEISRKGSCSSWAKPGPTQSPARGATWALAHDGTELAHIADCYLRQGDGGTKTTCFGFEACFFEVIS